MITWRLLLLLGSMAVASAHSVVLTWNPSAVDATHLAPTGYNVKRAAVSGGPYATVGSTAAPTTTYTDTTVVDGATYFYVVTAIVTGGESAPSNQTTCAVPFPAPNPPAGLQSQVTP